MSEAESWQREVHEAHDIMSGAKAYPARYIVGKQGATLAESVLSVAMNEAAALLSVGNRWDSERAIQVLDVSTWTLYVFDTDRKRKPTRLTDADEIHEIRAGEDDSKGAPWES